MSYDIEGRYFTAQAGLQDRISFIRSVYLWLMGGFAVAGLAALGAANSRGAEVYATDVRPETAEQVETIVGKMPPQRQQIFRMSRFEHMPSREIAEQLNLSVRTVDKHLELALKELRKYLNIIPAIIVFLDILP